MRIPRLLISSLIVGSSFTVASVASVASGQSEVRADYIVTFRNASVMNAGVGAVEAAGGRVYQTYRHALNGVAVSLPVAAVRALTTRAEIVAIERDAEFTADDTQTNATWGIDRIDDAGLPLDGTYTYTYNGTYNAGASRVDAYIIDTGILPTHVEFTGRVTAGYSTIKDRRGSVDCNGHGTHVAGTVGGVTYGVAKAVTLVPVRVLDCRGSGTTSGVIAGIDWVIANHGTSAAVANMSLGGGASSAMDTAVANLVGDGVVLAVAAGNSNTDACTTSPARAAAPLTVGATTSLDARASYSNFGSCVDIFAPGSSITSAWYSSKTATNTISGTSMATPHVTGVAALVLSAYPTLGPADVMSKIIAAATKDAISSVGTNSPNLLLYSLVP